MAEHDAGQGLDLDIAHRGALDLGEIADLLLREADVVERLRRDLRDHRGDVGLGQAEARRRPFVEALAEIAHGAVAAGADIGDDRLDRGANLRVGLFLLTGQRGRLDVPRHQTLSRARGRRVLTYSSPSSSLASSLMRSRSQGGVQTSLTRTSLTPGTEATAFSTSPGMLCATGQAGVVSVIST